MQIDLQPPSNQYYFMVNQSRRTTDISAVSVAAASDLGEEAPEDLTLNMLRFRARDTTLVMARSPVANDKTLDQAIDDQLRMLRKKSGAMTITPTKIARLGGGEHSVEAREMAIEFKVGDKPNFQLQAACMILGQHRLLVINYSKSTCHSTSIKPTRTEKIGACP
ncbi:MULTISPECIES: DcrB-related protein [Pseudomonas]|uniref:DcrB-related protein n=1 Tax=Pseudomonas TaxID=286 RepID=UPI001FFF72F9|nr:DcrB-related protein [Pseudomonas sp. A2]